MALNGHDRRFGQRGSDRAATAGRALAADVAIVERLPAPEELQGLLRAVGWAHDERTDRAAKALAGAWFGVVAVAGECVVGSGVVLGDELTFAYLKDIVIHPEWQGRGGVPVADGQKTTLSRGAP